MELPDEVLGSPRENPVNPLRSDIIRYKILPNTTCIDWQDIV